MTDAFEFQFAGNINVQSMDRQSGIFIGENNKAIGWSAHGKTNNVIGKIGGQSNLIYQNLLILNDPDYIDTPIDDRDINLSFETAGGEETKNFTVDNVNVNAMQQNCVVAIGESRVTGMDANEKVNQSHGSIYGNGNHSILNHNVNIDEDVLDAIIEDRDIKMANIQKND